MTADSIAARLNAQSSGRGRWTTHCPAHNDRSPSLSIAEGDDGRVLLFCHAGCEIEAIAQALGIEVRDLFHDNVPDSWRSANTACVVSTAELCAALRREAELYRERYRIEGELRTNELNEIRGTVARRLGIVLDELPRLLHEGSYGGRERDPAWAATFDQALFVAGVELLGAPIPFDETLPPPRMVLVAAEDYAAAAMRSLERRARGTFFEGAA
jgi:hypothetical protein